MTDINISALTSLDESAWRAYVNSHPDATIYHTLEWRDIIYNEYKFEPVYLMAKTEGTVVGVLPMFLIKNLRGRRFVSLPFSIYGGPLGNTGLVILTLLAKCIEMVNEGKASSIEIRPFRQIDCAETLGFAVLEWGVGTVMDLTVGQDTLWGSFAERYNVLKGAKKGLRFILTDGERLQEFYRLQLMTRRRLGLPTPSLGYYESFFKGLPGMAKLAIVEKDGKAVAGDLFFTYKDDVLLALNVSDREYRDYKPNDFMIWSITEWACKAGFKRLDHGPVSFEEKGLLHFKKKWGGETVKASRYYYPTVVKKAIQTKGSYLFKVIPEEIAGLAGHKVIQLFG